MDERRSRLAVAVEISFLVLIFSLGFMQPNLKFRGLAVQFTDLIFLVTAGLWFVAIVLRRIDLRFDRIFILIALYFFGLFLSALFSPDAGFSLTKLVGEGYLFLLAVVTANLIRRLRAFKRVAAAWLAASLIGSIVAIVTVVLFYFGVSNVLTDYALHHYGSLPPGNYPRIQGTFIYPSMLCNYLGVSLMVLFAAHRLKWIGRNVLLFLAAAFIITIAFTITPGIGGVLLGISLWLWLIFRESNRRLLAKISLTFGIFAASAFLLVSSFTFRAIETSPFFFTFFGQRVDPTQRLLTWQAALKTFLEAPFFGKGLGLGVAEVEFLAPSGQLQLLTDAHNTWLNIAGQSGLFGVIPLFLICIAIFKRSMPFRFDGSAETTVRVCLAAAFVTAFLYQGLVGSFENARHLWVLIGLIIGLTADKESTIESRSV